MCRARTPEVVQHGGPAAAAAGALTTRERRQLAVALWGAERRHQRLPSDIAGEVALFLPEPWGWRQSAPSVRVPEDAPLRAVCGAEVGAFGGDLAWLGHSRALAGIPLSGGVWQWSVLCGIDPTAELSPSQGLCGWAVGVARNVALHGDPGEDAACEYLPSDGYFRTPEAPTDPGAAFFYAAYHSDGAVLLRRGRCVPAPAPDAPAAVGAPLGSPDAIGTSPLQASLGSLGDDDGSADFGHPQFGEGDVVTVTVDFPQRMVVFSVNGEVMHRVGGGPEGPLRRNEEDEEEDSKLVGEALRSEIYPMVGLSGGATATVVSRRRLR